jgi:hypothetical protein
MTSKKKSWGSVLDLNCKSGGKELKSPLGMRRMSALENKQSPSHTTNNQSVGSDLTTSATQAKKALAAKKQSKAMALATAPVKQIVMNGFMMYMSGNTLNMFSISICSMAIMSPLTSLFKLKPTFQPFEEGTDLTVPKILYLMLNLVWLSVGLYKMKSMQLLPSTSADYHGRILWKHMLEHSSIPPL